jgi:hypothetical protein
LYCCKPAGRTNDKADDEFALQSHVVMLQDPLDGKLAVMVSEYNMTEQKELQLQLAAQHCSLQR